MAQMRVRQTVIPNNSGERMRQMRETMRMMWETVTRMADCSDVLLSLLMMRTMCSVNSLPAL